MNQINNDINYYNNSNNNTINRNVSKKYVLDCRKIEKSPLNEKKLQ